MPDSWGRRPFWPTSRLGFRRFVAANRQPGDVATSVCGWSAPATISVDTVADADRSLPGAPRARTTSFPSRRSCRPGLHPMCAVGWCIPPGGHPSRGRRPGRWPHGQHPGPMCVWPWRMTTLSRPGDVFLDAGQFIPRPTPPGRGVADGVGGCFERGGRRPANGGGEEPRRGSPVSGGGAVPWAGTFDRVLDVAAGALATARSAHPSAATGFGASSGAGAGMWNSEVEKNEGG